MLTPKEHCRGQDQLLIYAACTKGAWRKENETTVYRLGAPARAPPAPILLHPLIKHQDIPGETRMCGIALARHAPIFLLERRIPAQIPRPPSGPVN